MRDLEFVELLFSELETQNIKYAVLRKADEIVTNSFNDIDWVIENQKKKQFDKILKNLCLKLNWKIEMRIQKDGFEAIRLHSIGDKIPLLLHFDLFNTFSWKGVTLFSNSELLEGRYKLNNIFSAELVTEAIIQLLTRYLFNGYVKKEYRNSIKEVFVNNHELVKIKLLTIFDEKKTIELIRLIEGDSWETLEEYCKTYKKNLLITQCLFRKNKFFKNKVKYIIYTLKRTLKKEGILIVFEGTDGSGKSTIINDLTEITYRSYDETYIDYFHWRPGIIKIGSKSKKGVERLADQPHEKKPYGRFKSISKFLILNIDYCLGYWLKIKWLLAKGHLVIFDRYYYDYYLDKRRYRLTINDKVLDIFKKIIPKPDITFLLVGDPEKIYLRKKEISIHEISIQIERLLENKNKFENPVLIDVDQTIDEVVGTVCNNIMEQISNSNNFILERELD